MQKQECIAMLLAGGQGSRLGVLTLLGLSAIFLKKAKTDPLLH